MGTDLHKLLKKKPFFPSLFFSLSQILSNHKFKKNQKFFRSRRGDTVNRKSIKPKRKIKIEKIEIFLTSLAQFFFYYRFCFVIYRQKF